MPSGCALRNPLGVAQMVMKLESALHAQGLDVIVSSDMDAFSAAKVKARGIPPAPMHDPAVCDFSQERAMWMGLKNAQGAVVGLQAYRFDEVHVSLAEWCSNYMIGVYMRRNELLVPQHAAAPHGSISHSLKGKLVYHGEVWIDKSVKGKEVVSDFSLLGAFLALIKWNFDTLWALTSQSIASRGYPGRMGYPIIERGFLRWAVFSEGIEPIEYLTVADRIHLENLIDEPVSSMAAPFGSLLKSEMIR